MTVPSCTRFRRSSTKPSTVRVCAVHVLGYPAHGGTVRAAGDLNGGSGGGEGSRTERQGRQAVRGPAQEGHEQVTGGCHLELTRLLEQGRKEQREQPEQEEQRQWQRRQHSAEEGCRPQGREEVELAAGSPQQRQEGPSRSAEAARLGIEGRYKHHRPLSVWTGDIHVTCNGARGRAPDDPAAPGADRHRPRGR